MIILEKFINGGLFRGSMGFKQFSFVQEIYRSVRAPERLSVSDVERFLRPYTNLDALCVPIDEIGTRGWFEELKICPTAENKFRITGRYVQQYNCGFRERYTGIWQPTKPTYVSIDVLV
ncbi:MAG: hypothetical protein A2912_03765 [Candidatus Buchananbacteria bacterium RIFCSPLOWO2_01_FULL_40_23b]|uniref:Uncharacterized protein n=1 Tax=Candidatus Buchananbacteria bacterium RIFCSPLOWO2_01_FULL_40_23b TaxID=1797544 RepID=A0A1G1YMH4_9BACT|nr:MAG: hypothetical protein A2912_03765 [Candidatus Buchananbacteria bacterium RIFCSPLOWO2_01_FULL_40_23b]